MWLRGYVKWRVGKASEFSSRRQVLVELENVGMKNANIRYHSLPRDGLPEDPCSAVLPQEGA